MASNKGYIAKLRGILKLVAFLLGFIIAVAMFVFSSPPSAEKMRDDSKQYQKELQEGKNPDFPEYLGAAYVGKTEIGGLTITGYDQCKVAEKSKPEDKRKTCPPPALITLSAVIGLACCLFSIVCLLLVLFMELNKNGLFVNIDMFGHLGAGACLMVAGIMTIGFAALAFMIWDCSEEFLKLHGTTKEDCSKTRDTLFRTIPFIIFELMLFINGAVSIVAGLTTTKKN